MTAEDKFSPQRLLYMCGLTALLLADSIFSAWYHRLHTEQLVVLAGIVLLFFPVFFAALSVERISGRLNGDVRTDLKAFTGHFTICILIYLLFTFVPDFYAPVLIPAMWLCCAGGSYLGMIASVFLNLVLCIGNGAGGAVYMAYTLLALYGCIMVHLVTELGQGFKKYIFVCLFVVSILIPVLCYYLQNKSISLLMIGVIAAEGVAEVLFLRFAYEPLTRQRQDALPISLQEIIEPDYPLVKDVRQYSQRDYEHAMKVSVIAEACARQVQADADVTAAAGFYYRLGKLVGEPFVENGVNLAKANCFPLPVVKILSEYNGEQAAISSLESAIVHIVDCVVTKFELLDYDTFQNSWNHDMVIYQTMNEKSEEGLYDRSGMNMNQFLKIRNFITKEVELS